jgi:hypothetical protein
VTTSPPDVIGVDPSQRHTALCLLRGAEPHFHEVKPTEDMLTAARKTRRETIQFVKEHHAEDAAWAIEKQLSVGGSMSALQFYFQMQILEIVRHFNPDRHPALIMPMPIQLKSYITKTQGCPSPKGRILVDHLKKQTELNGRISEHKAMAYYMALLGRDVLTGVWRYNRTKNEAPLHPWKTINGDRS